MALKSHQLFETARNIMRESVEFCADLYIFPYSPGTTYYKLKFENGIRRLHAYL